jgi:hypothetical protein
MTTSIRQKYNEFILNMNELAKFPLDSSALKEFKGVTLDNFEIQHYPTHRGWRVKFFEFVETFYIGEWWAFTRETKLIAKVKKAQGSGEQAEELALELFKLTRCEFLPIIAAWTLITLKL